MSCAVPRDRPVCRFGILAAGLLCLCLSQACAVPDVHENTYPTRQAAVDAGALRRGWVPGFLPASATGIHEAHTLDSREIWAHFSFAASDPPTLPPDCAPVDPLHVAYPRGTRQFSWWPAGIQGAASLPSTPYRFFRCPAPGQYPGQSYEVSDFVAIDAQGSRAWFWRP